MGMGVAKLGTRSVLAAAGLLAGLVFCCQAHAQDATWLTNPGSGDFNTATNWNPAGVPTGTASFGVSNTPSLTFSSASTSIAGFNFNPGASSYLFSVGGGQTLTFTGAGVSTNGGAATFNNVGAINFDNASTGGTARFINGTAGVIDLFGLTTAGLTMGSIEGGGTITLGTKNLTVGGNNLTTTFGGSLLGGAGHFGGGHIAGSLTKVGAGTLTLSGMNSYTDATTINGGTLIVNGSIASSILTTVNDGGVLGGTGMVGSTQVNSGGILAPGSGAPGTSMQVLGNLAFQSGAFYSVRLGATASMANVIGTATLAGTVQVTPTAAVTKGSFDILQTTGGLGGTTFTSLSTPNFSSNLSYTTTDVFLNVTAAALGAGTTLNQNQQNVANAISAAFNSGAALPAGFLNLFNLSGAPLANALTQISGETAVGSQQTTFDAMSQFMGLLTDPFMNRGGGFGGAPSSSGYAEEGQASAYASGGKKTDAFAMFTKAPPPFEQRWSVWAAGFGGSQSTDGNAAAGTNNTTSNIAGTAVGADYLLSPNTLLGFALGGGGTSFSVANGGTGRSDLFQAGAYVRHNQGPAYISAALAYGWQDVTTSRTVTVAGLDQLRAEFNANAFSGRLEGGYRFVSPIIGGIGITPYAAAQFVTFDLPAYAETVVSGAPNFALNYGAQSVTDSRSELGIRTDKSFAVQNGILTVRSRFAWAHDFDPDRSVAATFQTLPGASFVVGGASQASDSALTTGSLEMKWRNGWSAAATFEGEFSNVTQSYAGKGVVRYIW